MRSLYSHLSQSFIASAANTSSIRIISTFSFKRIGVSVAGKSTLLMYPSFGAHLCAKVEIDGSQQGSLYPIRCLFPGLSSSGSNSIRHKEDLDIV